MAAMDGYIKTALSKYKYPDQAKRDILNVFPCYTDLRPKLEPYVFNDGSTRDLLCLEGTLPVKYKGSSYNIPVCLWVMNTHPYNPPFVYVRPTSDMRIRQGKHVDGNGKIDLSYLREWLYPQSDLLGLIQVLCIIFGDEPPVYSIAGVSSGAVTGTMHRAESSAYSRATPGVSNEPGPARPPFLGHGGYPSIYTYHLPVSDQTEEKQPVTSSTAGSMPGQETMVLFDASPSSTEDLVDRKMGEKLVDRYVTEQYAYQNRVTIDVVNVLLAHKDMKPRLESLDEQSRKDLLVLEGSITAMDDAVETRMEVTIWVPERYPQEPPLVYVLPETTFRTGATADQFGKVTMPYTAQWTKDCDLLGLLCALSGCL